MRFQPFALDNWLDEHKFGSSNPIDLASSTGPEWTLGGLLELAGDGALDELLETPLVYSNSSGNPKLRQAIAEFEGCDPEHVLALNGASEALWLLFFLASEPGANVVVPSPCYPVMSATPRALGLECRRYALRAKDDFRIDLEEVKALVDANTRFVLVNTPHNPTGAVLSDAEMSDLAAFCLDRGVQFVSDQVYHPIYHGTPTASAAGLPGATVLGDLSKALCLSGLRCGWLVEPSPERREQYLQARCHFTISNSPLSERMAGIALEHHETILGRARSAATTNLAVLDDFFQQVAGTIDWVRPAGGLTAFPWFTDGSDARPFCRELVKQGALVAPGDCFEQPPHFRLGFGVTLGASFAKGLSAMTNALAARA